jgi:hypothetical protein
MGRAHPEHQHDRVGDCRRVRRDHRHSCRVAAGPQKQKVTLMSAIAYLSVGLGSITIGEAAILMLLCIVVVKRARGR